MIQPRINHLPRQRTLHLCARFSSRRRSPPRGRHGVPLLRGAAGTSPRVTRRPILSQPRERFAVEPWASRVAALDRTSWLERHLERNCVEASRDHEIGLETWRKARTDAPGRDRSRPAARLTIASSPIRDKRGHDGRRGIARTRGPRLAVSSVPTHQTLPEISNFVRMGASDLTGRVCRIEVVQL